MKRFIWQVGLMVIGIYDGLVHAVAEPVAILHERLEDAGTASYCARLHWNETHCPHVWERVNGPKFSKICQRCSVSGCIRWIDYQVENCTHPRPVRVRYGTGVACEMCGAVLDAERDREVKTFA